MKKILSVLFLLALGLALAFQSCSDTQKETPEPEPGPGGDTTVVVPPVQKWQDTVTMFKDPSSANYAVQLKYDLMECRYHLGKTIYNDNGQLTSFRFLRTNMRGGGIRCSDSVTIEWKDNSLIMKYDETGPEAVDGSGCVATYTLNDKRMLEKVVVKTAVEEKEYKAEYTDLEFKLIDVKASKTLYSGKIEAGGIYGDWTSVTSASHEGVTIKVGYSDVKNQSRMDLFFMSSFPTLGMPKVMYWAHVAGLLPGNTKLYNMVTAEYEGKSLKLYDMYKDDYFSSETEFYLMIDDDGISDEAAEAIESGIWFPTSSIQGTYEIKDFEREGK